MNKSWNEKWVGRAREYASWSKDPSTKVGCVLVDAHTNTEVAGGYNGFPRRVREHEETVLLDTGVKHIAVAGLDPQRWSRPTKYLFAEHAQRNAIYNAARLGRSTAGCWAYLSWDPTESVCADCARGLIQAGIHTLLGPGETVQGRMDIPDDKGWRESCKTGIVMLTEAQVNIVVVPWYVPQPGPQADFMSGGLF